MAASKSKIFFIICLGFILGIFLGRYLNYSVMAVLAMIFIVAITVGWNNKVILIFGIAGIFMLAGCLRFRLDFAQNDLAQFYGQKVGVVGVVSAEPDERSDKTYLTLGDLEIDHKPIHSKLLISLARFPTHEYGEKLTMTAKIQEPAEFDDFSYKNYLSRFGIQAVAYYPKISKNEKGFGNPIKAAILILKKNFVIRIAEILPEPQNAFLGGLLLGSKHAIPEDLTTQFQITGTSHIIAVSGYNITIIADAIAALFVFLGLKKRLSFVLSLLAIIIFVIMTGASASVVRAGIMGALLLVAFNAGRLYISGNILTFTAAMMLLINPQILAFDIGFQLSFGALLGLVYITPVIEKHFWWVPKVIRKYFLATLSAQIFTLPILLFNFGTLSLIAIPVNILILSIVPITMLFGFLTGIVGLIWVQLALPFAWITWLLLTYMLKVVGIASALPFASIQFKINIYLFSIYYLLLLIFLVYHYNRTRILDLINSWKPKPEKFFNT